MIIDKEFKSLIPPLSADEYRGLEASILAEGCRDALVVWGDTLVDGHNRYEICSKHNIEFKTLKKDFASRDDVMLWMIDNQFRRRNLSEADRILLAQKKQPIITKLAADRAKAERTKFYGNQFTGKVEWCSTKHHSTKPIHTRRELAKIANVSVGTLAKFEQVQKKKPEMIEEIRKGDTTISKAYNAIKLEEKKEEIKQAERQITEQVDDALKPVLFVGDCTKAAVECDLLLTDPPYSTDIENIEDFVDGWLYNALDNVKDSGFAYVFIGAYPNELKAYLNAKTPAHIKLIQPLIWTYKNTLGRNPKDRYKLNYQVCLFYRGVNAPALDCPLTSEQWAVQEMNAPDGRLGDRYHAWQKPLELGERFIRHSTKKGQTVYDPFACTGTFLLAAAKLGRKAFGYEINEDNARIAFERGCLRA